MANPPSKSNYNTHEPQPNTINSNVSSLFDVATGPPATNLCKVHYKVSETPTNAAIYISYKFYANIQYNADNASGYKSIQTNHHLQPLTISATEMNSFDLATFKARIIAYISQTSKKYPVNIIAVYSDSRSILTWNHAFTKGLVHQPATLAMTPLTCFPTFRFEAMDTHLG
ncbi:hypothetical protein PtB15_13B95 [Puccinia triticina]|nr:hypothetical protein PtB15_13B95 [Puccinia triticina]